MLCLNACHILCLLSLTQSFFNIRISKQIAKSFATCYLSNCIDVLQTEVYCLNINAFLDYLLVLLYRG